MNLRGIILCVVSVAAAAAIGLAAFLVASPGRVDVAEAWDQTINVKESTLTDHECNANQWHFVITQINEGKTHAPTHLHIAWANGEIGQAARNTTIPGAPTAQYNTWSNLDSTVISASADIYSTWGTGGVHGNGQFVLSHGPCPATPTPCADDEERLPDGTCRWVPPLEEWPPEHCKMSDRVPDAADCFAPTPTPTPMPTATPTPTPAPATSGVAQPPSVPSALPDTGGAPEGYR